MNRTFKVRRPDDFHVHLRDGTMLGEMAGHTFRHFKRALVMPNTTEPITTANRALAYRSQILSAAPAGAEPLMTIKLTEDTTSLTIREAKEAGVIAAKYYPKGATTNSSDGVSEIRRLYPCFDQMEQSDMVLCLHGEEPSAFCLDREQAFLTHLSDIVRNFPKLKIVLEHVTTHAAVAEVLMLPDTVAATITVHHLFLTLDNVIGDNLEPHHFCKPIPKRPDDRRAVYNAALSGNPKFFLGTDSAPHARNKKECSSGCAGVFTAPVALSLLAGAFEIHAGFGCMEAFTSEYGARFYGLPLNEGTIELIRERWTVPSQYKSDDHAYDAVVPFYAGRELLWQVRA